MRINELQLYGFKSFANKTSIKFDDNFIGIVGPNGSGKSNIIDAIKWVFGEQSAKSLRGKSSSDIIFGGSQTRKKANFAEVTLILDNESHHIDLDYREIAITRRLYRSGDSEYLINNNECRLKDIIDLFMDSGIGKNSFSIISQGKVEEIIVSKPEMRRQVIEDISGVLKYKKRKENALRKLEKTTQNLQQAELIINQLQQRLEPLRIQNEKATKLQALKKDLKNYEVSYLANRIYQINEDVIAYRKMIDDLNQKIVVMNNNISIYNANLEEINNIDVKIKTNLNALNNKINETQNEIYQLQSNLKMITERQKLYATTDKEQTINKLQASIIKNQELLNNKNNDLQKKEYDLNNYYQNLNEYKTNLTNNRNLKYDLENQLADIVAENKRNKYPYSIIALKNSNLFHNINVLKDLFQVSNQYAECINICLGSRLNDIIMENIDDIKRAIKYLNENKAGRATFLNALDTKAYLLNDDVLTKAQHQKGYIGVAYELITYDQKYDNVFKNILGNTLIFDTLENANQAFNILNKRNRIVTLNGELLANNGTISGGKFKKTNPLLLNQSEKDVTKQLSKINNNISLLLEEIKAKETLIHDLEITCNGIKQEINEIMQQIKIDQYELEKMDVKLEQTQGIDLELQALREEFITLNNKKIKFDDELDKLANNRVDLINEMKNDNEEIKLLTNEMNQYNIKLSKLEMELDLLTTNLSEDYQLSFTRAYELCEKNIDIPVYKDKVHNLKQQIKNIGFVNMEAISEYQDVKEKYQFLDNQRQDLLVSMEKLTNIMDELDEVVIIRFQDAYDKLRKEFQIIFAELFGGGKADLILSDKDNLLETGVEIIAQPPGKKLQTISLLSGGEKALTAIALLFSILQIKRVPFTILDEVEAALDEVNVKRYAQYIKIFSEKTQFLVITHRQGTMSLCDSLYGVTMIEKGISTIFKTNVEESMKLEENKG